MQFITGTSFCEHITTHAYLIAIANEFICYAEKTKKRSKRWG